MQLAVEVILKKKKIIQLNQQGFGLLVSLMIFHLMTPFFIVLSYHEQRVNNYYV